MNGKYSFNLTLFLIFLVIFIGVFIFFKVIYKPKLSHYMPAIPAEPNYYLQSAGSTPSHKYMDDPAERMDTPYYEGPYGDMILPDYIGMYDENPDYASYAGIFPS